MVEFSVIKNNILISQDTKAMFTLHRIGFCYISEVARLRCE